MEMMSEKYSSQAEEALKKLNLKLTDSKKIAEAILRLSNYYISYPQIATPWKESWAQVAYLAYYHRSRTHLGLSKDAPDGRPACVASGQILVSPEVGGLHHRYDRQAA